MMSRKVTVKTISDILDEAEVKVDSAFGQCVTVTVKLKNGFVLAESSPCAFADEYEQHQEELACWSRIRARLCELEEYHLKRVQYASPAPGEAAGTAPANLREEIKREHNKMLHRMHLTADGGAQFPIAVTKRRFGEEAWNE